MRCKNCGWPNKPNETTCVKCGTPLEAETSMAGNNLGGYQPQPSIDNDGIKKTVLESSIFQNESINEPPLTPTKPLEEESCPKCGYPLRPNASKCPNCNNPISMTPSEQKQINMGPQRRPTRIAIDTPTPQEVSSPTRSISPNNAFKGTINPYMMNYQQDPVFVLQPLKRMNERKTVEAVELEGSEVILTRDNTEPGNLSITTQEQAVVSHANGHWYIEDLSEQKTTFVQASQKIELHDGDIILLGNRLFEFKTQ